MLEYIDSCWQNGKINDTEERMWGYVKQNFKMRVSGGYPHEDFFFFLSIDSKNRAVLFSVSYFGNASEESQN